MLIPRSDWAKNIFCTIKPVYNLLALYEYTSFKKVIRNVNALSLSSASPGERFAVQVYMFVTQGGLTHFDVFYWAPNQCVQAWHL